MNIQGKFDDLKNELINLKDIVIKFFLEENKVLSIKAKQLEVQVIETETNLNNLDQYGRHNNLQVTEIPIDIGNQELENNVVKILGSIWVEITKDSFEAVHRLGKPE